MLSKAQSGGSHGRSIRGAGICDELTTRLRFCDELNAEKKRAAGLLQQP
jgi:hypothetical protein